MTPFSEHLSAQRPHLRLVWSAAENQSDNMRLLYLIQQLVYCFRLLI